MPEVHRGMADNFGSSIKSALIFGGSGQDGAWLSKLLITKGYRVTIATRSHDFRFPNLFECGVLEDVNAVQVDYANFEEVAAAVSVCAPSEIYNLAGQSSVGLSFNEPAQTLTSIISSTQNILEAIRVVDPNVRFYNAGSSEIFGNSDGRNLSESSPIQPRSPYGAAKAASLQMVSVYRQCFNLFACTGILFNHESHLRPETYVTRKVAIGAAKISLGRETELRLGNLDVCRDWGFAPEYADAMWRMLQIEKPQDLVIGTGSAVKLSSLVRWAFNEVGLNWEDYVIIDQQLIRPTDIHKSCADPSAAASVLGWEASTTAEHMIRKMVRYEYDRLR